MKPLLLALLRALGRCRCRLGGARLGRGVLVHGWPRVRARRGGRILIGDRVTINSAGWSNPFNAHPATLYAGPGALLELLPGAGISGCQIIAHHHIRIGSDTLVGAGTLVCDSDMHGLPLARGGPPATAPVTIGNHVFLGARSIVLKGVTIGDHAVVAAGSIVTRNVPPHALAAGQPARTIRQLDHPER